jgi:hypothetical protein
MEKLGGTVVSTVHMKWSGGPPGPPYPSVVLSPHLFEPRLYPGHFLFQLVEVVLQVLNLFGGRREAPPAHAGAATRLHPTAAAATMMAPAADGATAVMPPPAAMTVMVMVAVAVTTCWHHTHIHFPPH